MAIVGISCSDETEILVNDQALYWGCWREVNNTDGVYDIILEENTPGTHKFSFGNNCKEDIVSTLETGTFRNDTLIIDNGNFEYWCYIKSDTLYYSAYAPSALTFEFIKAK